MKDQVASKMWKMEHIGKIYITRLRKDIQRGAERIL